VRSLARARRVQIIDQRPYDDPFLAQVDYYGNQFGGVDLAEIGQYADPRWPGRQGRCLWFRLPPPITDHVPDDDQLIQLELLQEGFIPEAFDEFMGTTNRSRAWNSDTGRYLHWLLCGPQGDALASRASSATNCRGLTKVRPPRLSRSVSGIGVGRLFS